MPVQNGLPYLAESIESILAQTFTDFEFVILENGSTDETLNVVEQYRSQDSRIRVETVPDSLGLAGSSHEAVQLASSELIARMDADDVSFPRRLERQMDVFRSFPDAVVVASLFECIDRYGVLLRGRDRANLLSKRVAVPFAHGSVMFRRQAYDQVGGYRSWAEKWEDHDLFLRLLSIGKTFVIPEALYRYRFHENGSSRALAGPDGIEATARKIRTSDRFKRASVSGVRDEEDEKGATREEVLQAAHDAYTLAAAMTIWSGRSPKKAGLRRPPGLPRLGSFVRAVVYGLVGSVHPRFLRRVLAQVIRLRDLVAGIYVGERVMEWPSRGF